MIGRNYAYKPCLIKDADFTGDDAILGSEVEVEVIGSTSSTSKSQNLLRQRSKQKLVDKSS